MIDILPSPDNLTYSLVDEIVTMKTGICHIVTVSNDRELIGEISLVESSTSVAEGLEKISPPQYPDPVPPMNKSLGI